MKPVKEVRLRKGKESSLSRLHPWIFSGALHSVSEGLVEGDLVRVIDSSGRIIGYGDWQIGSIAVRMISFGQDEPDDSYIKKLLYDAIEMRLKIGLKRPDNNTFRLVHGEGDFLPGLVVDLYSDTAVVQAHSPAMHRRRNSIATMLVENTLLNIKNVFYKSETTLPYKAGLNPEDGYLIGGDSNCESMENGLKFRIDWLRGQKTGFFIDQRDNRELLRRYSSGKNVLNMFCYTGGFSVYALSGNADRVVSVDSSAKAISLTDSNVGLNFSQEIAGRHESVAVDAFKYLDEMKDGEFDLIVLDPPAFAKHRDALKNALRGYQKLNAKAIGKVAKGGLIFTFSCSQAVTKEQFQLAVFSASVETGRKVRVLHRLTQPADHPVSIYHPEGEYLKGLVLYVE